MSTPASDNESSGHKAFAPKKLREQPRIPAVSQPRASSSSMSPSHAGEALPSFLKSEAVLQPYEPEAVSQPQMQRRRYSVPTWVSWLMIVASCTAMLVMFAKPLWHGLSVRRDTSSEAPPLKLSDRLAAISLPTDSVTGIAATSETQQPSSVPAQPAQLAPLALQSEQKSIESPVQGVTDKEILFGISAPLSGAAKELGQNIKLGFDAAFKVANTIGGVHGRQLRLISVDDGYEPTRTAETMKQLYEQDRVFGIVGNVGTPTAVVALPYALERRMLFYGAFTGAGLLRRNPPDRYVFNYRASYAEETDAVVRYLVKVLHLRPDRIAVFAQHDAFGDAGFDGVAKAVRALQGDESAITRLDYERNTVNVDDAVTRLRGLKNPVEAVVMVATYRAAARFIEKTRDLYPTMIYTNVSFVGSTALADELMLL